MATGEKILDVICQWRNTNQNRETPTFWAGWPKVREETPGNHRQPCRCKAKPTSCTVAEDEHIPVSQVHRWCSVTSTRPIDPEVSHTKERERLHLQNHASLFAMALLCVHINTHIWRSKVDCWYFPLLLSSLFFLDRVFQWLGAPHFGYTGGEGGNRIHPSLWLLHPAPLL